MPLPDIRIQNTGTAQSNVPFTFGQVFAAGDLMPGEGLAGKLADGSSITLQVDQKATHGDGSVRHAIVSGILPALAKGATAKFDLVKAAKPSWAGSMHADDVTASVKLLIAGKAYTASLDLLLTANMWLAGPIVGEASFSAPLKDDAGNVHPLLTVTFGVRWYPGNSAIRVEVIVENTSTWKTADKITYDADVQINGKSVYSKASLTHYHHARWHQYFWAGTTPAIHVQHNTAYIIGSKAVSNYEQLTIPEDAIINLTKSVPADAVGPMTIGPVMPSMPSTGGRSDIGPLPAWSVLYLLSMDKRAKDVMMAAADGSGSWSIHYRDDNTGAPLRLDNEASKNITTHWNAVNSAPLPNPWFAPGGELTPYTDDVSHHPDLAYLPYLLTGDRFYLEELQFWTTANPLKTVPLWRGFEKGLMRWEQMRGQAWALRDLGRAAYISPDNDPMKAYFAMQRNANLDFYYQTYVVGNPNKLGVYDGSGEFSTPYPRLAPWQDDFLSWSFSHLAELGSEKAGQIYKWKSQFVLGRMGGDGFCQTMAATDILGMREADGSMIASFKRLYDFNFQFNDFYVEGGRRYENLALGSYYDQGCNTNAQAKYLSLAYGFDWAVGRMVGSASSPQGTVAIMQPNLAAAVDAGMPGAAAAWQRLMTTPVRPDYRYSPEWDIVPRPIVTVTPPVIAPPPPVVTPPSKKGKITVLSNVKLKKMTKLLVQVFNPVTRELIRSFDNVTTNSSGGFMLQDVALIAETECGYSVIDAKGKALVINLAKVV